MTVSQIEKRLAALEAEVANLKRKSSNRWWDKIAGVFADDPLFEKAMRNGRAWREPTRGTSVAARNRTSRQRKAGR